MTVDDPPPRADPHARPVPRADPGRRGQEDRARDGRRDAGAPALPRRHRGRWRRSRLARARGRPPGRALPAARGAPEDRPRRGVHGRRLAGRAGHRPRPGPDAVRGADGPARAQAAALAARPGRPRHPAPPAQHPRGLAQQHQRALRPEQRPLRRVPRPVDVLQLGPLRPHAGRSPSRTCTRRSCARSTPILDAADVRGRQPGARDRHRLGRARHPGRPSRRDRHLGDPVGRAARPRDEADRRGRRHRARRRAAAGLPRGRPASSTRSSASR